MANHHFVFQFTLARLWQFFSGSLAFYLSKMLSEHHSRDAKLLGKTSNYMNSRPKNGSCQTFHAAYLLYISLTSLYHQLGIKKLILIEFHDRFRQFYQPLSFFSHMNIISRPGEERRSISEPWVLPSKLRLSSLYILCVLPLFPNAIPMRLMRVTITITTALLLTGNEEHGKANRVDLKFCKT